SRDRRAACSAPPGGPPAAPRARGPRAPSDPSHMRGRRIGPGRRKKRRCRPGQRGRWSKGRRAEWNPPRHPGSYRVSSKSVKEWRTKELRKSALHVRVARLEPARSLQILIDGASRLAALPLRPHHERLSATAIARGKYSRLARRKLARVRAHVP